MPERPRGATPEGNPNPGRFLVTSCRDRTGRATTWQNRRGGCQVPTVRESARLSGDHGLLPGVGVVLSNHRGTASRFEDSPRCPTRPYDACQERYAPGRRCNETRPATTSEMASCIATSHGGWSSAR